MLEFIEEKDKFEGLSLLTFLEKVEDPRIGRKKLHPLSEILFVALYAMRSVFESFRAFEIWCLKGLAKGELKCPATMLS